MKKLQKNPIDCRLCKFFLKYYIVKNLQFQPTLRGHCIHSNNHRMKAELCQYYEVNKDVKKANDLTLKEYLSCISNRLSEICTILSEKEDV